MDRERLVAVIMAGGGGTRFWPRSRRKLPKQFLAPEGADSLLKLTVERLRGVIDEDHILIITGEDHVDLAREHSGLSAASIIPEPEGRDTAACIGFGALHARRIHPEAVMVVLPADHLITPTESFHDTVLRAADFAADSDTLVTIGLRPHRPATGYGYIEAGERLDGERPVAHRVKSFREKPDLETARRFVLAGRFLWNSGIFSFSTDTVLKAIQEHLPELYQKLLSISDVTDRDAVARVYPSLPKISIDYGVLERAQNKVVIEAAFEWDDVGTFEAVARHARNHGDGNMGRGDVAFIGATDSLVDNDVPGLVVVSGLDDVLVVRTADAVLVMRRSENEGVKEIVKELERRGLDAWL